jgi:hypothetical protein
LTSRALALTAVIVVGAAVFPQGRASAKERRAVRCSQARGYAGVVGPSPAAGVAAEVTALATPVVRWGHVAAWVGLSSGVVGSGAWIQAGISGFEQGQTTLYYEVARPSTGPVYHLLAYDVPTDEPHALAVLEEPSAPGSWRVWLDGAAVSPVIDMPGSHALWRPMVMAESWNGPESGCNLFRFAFAKMQAEAGSGGAWRTLARAPRLLDRGYRLVSSGGRLVASATAGP